MTLPTVAHGGSSEFFHVHAHTGSTALLPLPIPARGFVTGRVSVSVTLTLLDGTTWAPANFPDGVIKLAFKAIQLTSGTDEVHILW